MLSEERVRQNFWRVMREFHSYNPETHTSLAATLNPHTHIIDMEAIPHDHVAGDRCWRAKIFREDRKKHLLEQKMRRITEKAAANDREARKDMICACIGFALWVGFMALLSVFA